MASPAAERNPTGAATPANEAPVGSRRTATIPQQWGNRFQRWVARMGICLRVRGGSPTGTESSADDGTDDGAGDVRRAPMRPGATARARSSEIPLLDLSMVTVNEGPGVDDEQGSTNASNDERDVKVSEMVPILEEIAESFATGEVAIVVLTVRLQEVTSDIKAASEKQEKNKQELEQRLVEHETKIEDLTEIVNDQAEKLKRQDVQIKEQDVIIKEQKVIIKAQDMKIKAQDMKIKAQDMKINGQEVKIMEHESKLQQLEKKFGALAERLEVQEQEDKDLKQLITKLQEPGNITKDLALQQQKQEQLLDKLQGMLDVLAKAAETTEKDK